MRLQRIYSSKLYVTSTRKDRIHAAIQDPINAELVQQLSEYLDEDGQVVLQQAEQQIEQNNAAQPDAENTNNPASADGESAAPSSSGGGSSSFSGDIFKDFGEVDTEESEASEDIETPETQPESAPVEETTDVSGSKITASTTIIWNTIDDVISDCETIKGTLNLREDTHGVTRLQVSDSELWIYFNDEVNLNDTMIEVISVLNAAGYTYLKFNRLARSNNAIVFDINLNANEPVKPETELLEEVK